MTNEEFIKFMKIYFEKHPQMKTYLNKPIENLNLKELDFYIPSKGIDIEFDGLSHHLEKPYDKKALMGSAYSFKYGFKGKTMDNIILKKLNNLDFTLEHNVLKITNKNFLFTITDKLMTITNTNIPEGHIIAYDDRNQTHYIALAYELLPALNTKKANYIANEYQKYKEMSLAQIIEEASQE